MLNLVKNELIKLVHRKKTIVVLIGFIALISIMAFSMNNESNTFKKMQTPEFQKKNLNYSIDAITHRLKESSISEEEKNQLEASLKSSTDELEVLESGKEIDWKDQAKNYIERLKKDKVTANYSFDQEEHRGQIVLYQYLLDNNIKPVNDLEFYGSTYLKSLFSMLGTIFLAVIVAILLADIVSGEYSPATVKFLLTQPVSRGKVLLSKFITAILSSVFLICIVEIIAFVIVGLIVGFGNMNYPKLVGTKYQFNTNTSGEVLIGIIGTGHIITTSQFLLEAFLLQILFVVACTSFIFMLSTILKNSMVVMGTSVVAIISVTILAHFSAISKLASFIFIIYGDTPNILNGGMGQQYLVPSITIELSIIVMTVWTVVCYLISHLVFVRRDIL